jgi:hypothetical protein
MPRYRIPLIATLLIWLACAIIGQGDSLCPKIHGRYQYTVYQGRENPIFSKELDFTIQIRDCRWSIQTREIDATHYAGIDTGLTTFQCDGQSIYVILERKTVDIKSSDFLPVRRPDGDVTIYPESYPSPREPALQHIWLGYAANCLMSAPSGTCRSPFAEDLDIFLDQRLLKHYEIDQFKATGSRTIAITDSGKTATRDSDGNIKIDRLAEPYGRGYLTARGIWAQTNILGHTCSNFQFIAYSPNPRGKLATDLIKSFVAVCTITNLTEESFPEIPLLIKSGMYSVEDRRHENIGKAVVRYIITNGIPNTKNLNLKSLVASTPAISLAQESLFRQTGKIVSQKTKGSYKALAIILISLPLTFLIIYRIARNKQPRSNTK